MRPNRFQNEWLQYSKRPRTWYKSHHLPRLGSGHATGPRSSVSQLDWQRFEWPNVVVLVSQSRLTTTFSSGKRESLSKSNGRSRSTG